MAATAWYHTGDYWVISVEEVNAEHLSPFTRVARLKVEPRDADAPTCWAEPSTRLTTRKLWLVGQESLSGFIGGLVVDADAESVVVVFQFAFAPEHID